MRYYLLFLAVIVAGCTHPSGSYHVRVSGVGTGPPARYHLAPAGPRIDPDDPQFREYAACAHRILQDHGFTPADPDGAEQVILLEYGVGMPSTCVGSHPHTGYRPISFYEGARRDQDFEALRDVNDGPLVGSCSVWPHHVAFFAYDADKLRKSQGREKVQLWSAVATSSGRSPDLRQVMPVLMAATARHLGNRTAGARHVTLAGSDPLIKEFAHGIRLIPAGQFGRSLSPPATYLFGPTTSLTPARQPRSSDAGHTAWDLLLAHWAYATDERNRTEEPRGTQGTSLAPLHSIALFGTGSVDEMMSMTPKELPSRVTKTDHAPDRIPGPVP